MWVTRIGASSNPKMINSVAGCCTLPCVSKERLRNRDNYLDKLESAFEAMTGHSEGQISEEKLEAVLQNPKAQASSRVSGWDSGDWRT